MKKTLSYLWVVFISLVAALSYSIFIFPNSFAPAGIDGICTMIQDASGISMGYLSILVNIPLLITAYFLLNRQFMLKSTIYVLCFSIAIVMLKEIGIEKYAYHTELGTSIVLAPILAGIIRGVLYPLTLKENGSAGGIDIIAALVKKYKPHFNMMNIVFILNTLVAISAYFVYDFKIEPVLCSILYALLTTLTSNWFRKSKNENIKFEIITSESKKLCTEITEELGFAATVIEAKGGHTGTEKEMVVSIVHKNQAPLLEDLIRKHSEVVFFESIVNNSITESEYRF